MGDDSDRRRARARAQLLHRPKLDVAGVVRHLLAVQAQDWRAARLAIRARSHTATAAGVDAALDGDLVMGWLCRGTLHLVAREDYHWLLGLTAPGRMAANARRLGQEGVTDPDGAVATVEKALADGPLGRDELAERLGTQGQATPHVLMLAALRGTVVLVGERRYALGRDVLGRTPRFDRDRALSELGRRYLAAHAPADEHDLAAWSGLPLRDARAALAPAKPPPPDTDPVPPRLLGPFDPYLLGWKDRSFAVPAELTRQVHPGGGILRATATVDGLAVGTWTVKGIDPPDLADTFAGELEDVARFGR